MENIIKNLKGDQAKTWAFLIEWLKSLNTYALLTGAAGTGKTYVVSELYKLISNAGGSGMNVKRVAVTAPTHQAVGVIRQKCGVSGKDSAGYGNFKTIHSLLGLKLKWKKESQSCERDPMAPPPMIDDTLIVVDETSMVTDELVDHIKRAVESSSNTKVLFVGDYRQLPPVQERLGLSRTMSVKNKTDMAQILRQAEGNSIITTAHNVANNRAFKIISDYDPKTKQGVFITGNAKKFLDAAVNSIKEHGASNSSVLSFTNKVKNDYNYTIRSMLGLTGQIQKGDYLIADCPISEATETKSFGKVKMILKPICENGTHITVNSVENTKDAIFGINMLKISGTTGSGDEITFEVPERQEDVFDKKEALLQKALAKEKGGWARFYGLMDWWNQVSFGWAITTHKSQGKTLKRAYVVGSDFANVKSPDMRQRLVYTALTRATDACIFLGHP